MMKQYYRNFMREWIKIMIVLNSIYMFLNLIINLGKVS